MQLANLVQARTQWIITEEEYAEQQKQVKKLRKRIGELTEAVYEAAQLGDLKENAEYHSAKEALAITKARLGELASKVSKARILTKIELRLILKNKRVTPFSVIQIELNDKKMWVGFRKSPHRKRAKIVSEHAPLGKSILGKEEGDDFKYAVGSREFYGEILKVEPFDKRLK